jgi:hypothetical protein
VHGANDINKAFGHGFHHGNAVVFRAKRRFELIK